MPKNGHELLPLVVQENNTFIDAQLLHQKLKVSTPFHIWVKRRIDEFGFENAKDFCTNLNESKGGRKSTNYLLTLDMAKELAMLERNEVGRQIRRYFIAKEKELRGISHLPKEQALFKGLKAKTINNRRLYPYVQVLARCGYNPKNNSSSRKAKYWMHFVKEGKISYVTEEFALHLYKQRQVYNNRVAMQAMQPVLALDFYPTQNKGGIA